MEERRCLRLRFFVRRVLAAWALAHPLNADGAAGGFLPADDLTEVLTVAWSPDSHWMLLSTPISNLQKKPVFLENKKNLDWTFT